LLDSLKCDLNSFYSTSLSLFRIILSFPVAIPISTSALEHKF
jgi:hypothetical protein